MFLFIIVSIIVAVNIKKINGMENIYLKYFIYFLLFNFFLKEMYNLYLSYFGKKSVTVTITVNPLKKLTIRSKPEFGIIADSMTSDKNGVVSFVIQQTGKENIYTELIYYRYTDQPKSAPDRTTYINTPTFFTRIDKTVVTAPVKAPVTVPVKAPVTAPVKVPVTAPVTAPVKAPVAAPVTAPI